MPEVISVPGKKEVTCPNCEAIIGYKPNEVRQINFIKAPPTADSNKFGASVSREIQGATTETTTKNSILCPNCNKPIFV